MQKDGARLCSVVPGEVALGKTGAQEAPLALRGHLWVPRAGPGAGPREPCLPQHAVVHQSNAFPGLLVLNAIENHFQNLGVFFFSSSKNKLQLFNQYLFHHTTGVEKKKKEEA